MIDYKQIEGLNTHAMDRAKERIDQLAKPLGSLGKLEEYAIKLAGIRGTLGGSLKKRGVLVFASDNGVHAQDITPVPKIVTAVQTINIANKITGVGVLAKHADADVFVFNVGVEPDLKHEKVINALVANGTKDISKESAMTYEQAQQAIETGYNAVAKYSDYDVLGIGEMGICNTTTTAAVASCLLNESPEVMTGKGAGITEEQFVKKINIIKQAIELTKPNKQDPIDVLAKVGGFDIAAMCGAFLGAAHYKIPVVIDGFISVCAALCAIRIAPDCQNYMFASHKSFEQGYGVIIEAINMSPAIDLEMRLGEGSGCPIMFNILEASLRMIEDMATFEEAEIDPTKYIDIRA